ncbi:PqqD family protein [Algihabitans albus]|uniref:PqqD family protein n=1 Tax=Algihabitans albus TaxID=2164067 RepID=UPI000E5D1616|nr:PqqD family protein [Algihabitans albus]
MRAAGRYFRNPAVTLAELEGQFFLVEPKVGQPYHLDTITSGIWRLLETPVAGPEIFEALAEAFPEEPPEQIVDDSARALDDLLAAGFVREG